MNNTKTTLLSNKDIMALKASSCDEYCIFFPFGLGVGIEPFSFPCAYNNALTVYNQAVKPFFLTIFILRCRKTTDFRRWI